MYNKTYLSQHELLARLRQPPQVRAEDIARVCGAWEMSEDVHRKQVRHDGTPYFWHVTRVSKILLDELNLRDSDLICAALLHDILEDSKDLTPHILELNFGAYVGVFLAAGGGQQYQEDERNAGAAQAGKEGMFHRIAR